MTSSSSSSVVSLLPKTNKKRPRSRSSGWHDRRSLDGLLRVCLFLMPASLLLCVYNMWVALFSFLYFAIYFITLESMSAPPANRPEVFLHWSTRTTTSQSRKCPVLLCLGDSLTHGNLSSSFTPEIPGKLAIPLGWPVQPNMETSTFAEPIYVVNAGENSLTSHVILHERLTNALRVQPDYVLILIGTNDVRGMYKNLWAKELIYIHDLPEPPTLENYERHLTLIIQQIRQSNPLTCIGLVTLPPLGENLQNQSNEWVRRANQVIERVVVASTSTQDPPQSRIISILRLYDRLESIIDKKKRRKWSIPVEAAVPLAFIMNPLFHVCGLFTWNAVSWWTGNAVLTDGIHLNDTARDILVDLIVDWLLANDIAKQIAAATKSS